MPNRHYKEDRKCLCGFSTLVVNHWNYHKKVCKSISSDTPAMMEQLKEQLAAMKEQLKAKDYHMNVLIQNNKRQKTEDTKENKGSKGSQGTKTLKMTEPLRRKIAMRQNWKCNDPFGVCRLKDKQLEEYDVDHIIRPSRGGTDTPENMQALCPACHRKKTELENLEDSKEIPQQTIMNHYFVTNCE